MSANGPESVREAARRGEGGVTWRREIITLNAAKPSGRVAVAEEKYMAVGSEKYVSR